MTKIEERVFVQAYEVVSKSDDYKRCKSNIIQLGQTLMQILGPNRRLLLEYERQIGLAKGIYLENVYRMGLEDGKLNG